MSTLRTILPTTASRRARGQVPHVHAHDNPQSRRLLDALPRLRRPYRPTPWLFNTHLQKFAVGAAVGNRVAASSCNGPAKASFDIV